jgi:hypothetical protein
VGALTSRDPAHRKVGTLPVDTRSLAYPANPSTEERPCACYEGVVYIGYVIEEDGDERSKPTQLTCVVGVPATSDVPFSIAHGPISSQESVTPPVIHVPG